MNTSRTLPTWAVTGVLFAGLLLVPTDLASANPVVSPNPEVKSSALAAPFNLAFTGSKVLVADGGLNLVGKLAANGAITPIATDQPGASGVAVAGGTLAFTTTVTKPETFENTASGLHLWNRKGKHVYADTLAYETAKNPDRINNYGVTNPTQCVADALAAAQLPASYTGQVDSHAYSVAAYRGDWIVADAGANALFRVNRKGVIKTLAVLPPQPTKVTAQAAAALGLPDCVAGVTYAFEPVPTDVEVGRDGYLYVTTLPGGPESAVLGARGALWKINPRTGKARQIAGGFLGATNLALGSHGKIYVAEFFAGKISVVKRSKKADFLTLPGVVAVETDRSGRLWAATMGSQEPAAPGTIVTVSGTSKGHAHKVKLTRHRALALGWPLRK